jgi:hypothetical protein
MSEIQDTERQSLLQRRDQLGDVFSKDRLFVSSGAVTLSVTMIKDFKGHLLLPASISMSFSWVLLCVSIVASLLAVYLAGLSHEDSVKAIDANKPYDYYRWPKYVNIANTVSIVGCSLGILLFGVTAILVMSQVRN